MRGLLLKDSVIVTLVNLGFVKTNMSDQFLRHEPFMISAQKAAKIIRRGLVQKKTVISFPFFLPLRGGLLRILPASLSDFILSKLKY